MNLYDDDQSACDCVSRHMAILVSLIESKEAGMSEAFH